MNFFQWKKRLPDEVEQLKTQKAELEARVRELEADLALYRRQNERIVHDASPAIRENAVLRYELHKCQSDRQVLEFHISGARAEARAALNLLSRLAPREVARGLALLEAVLFLVTEARALGLDSTVLQPLEDEAQTAWNRNKGAPWRFAAERWLALRVGGVLRALEQEREQALQAAVRPTEGLEGFDLALSRCADWLKQWLEFLAHSD
ncbi:MAG: hypothetical protein C4332_09585 [Meiothermus sp.]